MFNYECLDECPDKYSPTIDNKCVLTGFFCKFGYDMNAAGDGCYLKARVCNGRDVLNYDKTKCIPVSEFFIPIPMLILSCIGIYFVFKDKRQNKNIIHFLSCAKLYINQIVRSLLFLKPFVLVDKHTVLRCIRIEHDFKMILARILPRI